VLVAVAPQVSQEPVGCGRPLVAPPGQGEDKLRRRLDGHDDDPLGPQRAGGGFGHHRDGGAILDGPPVGAEGDRRGDGGFQHLGLEPSELAAHELEALEGPRGERARVHQKRLVPELAEGYHRPPRHVAAHAGQHGQPPAPQRLRRHLVHRGQGWHLVDDRDVQAALGELSEQPLADHRRTVHHDRLVLGLEGRQRRRNGRLGEVRDADPDQPGLTVPGHADPGHRGVKVGEQAAPALQQFRAGRGEFDTAPGPREQAHLKEALEPRDGLGQARLADEQARGRPPEVQFLGQHGEVAQIAELDPGGPATRSGAGKAHNARPGRIGRLGRPGRPRRCCGQRAGGHLALPLLQVMRPDVP